METINQRIYKAFTELGIKQVEFANRLGVSQAYISKLFKENSDKRPSERTINDICREFNVNKEWLLTGMGEMFATEDDLLEALTKELKHFDERERKFLLNYLKLGSKHRRLYIGYLMKLID